MAAVAAEAARNSRRSKACWKPRGAAKGSLSLLVLLLVAGRGGGAQGLLSSAPPKAFSSVPDLSAAMYTSVESQPCVRLLTESGPIGCGSPGRRAGSAPIQRLQSVADELSGSRVLLVSSDVFAQVLERASTDDSWKQRVVGVMLQHPSNSSTSFSPASTFPQSDFAPYADKTYTWNENGCNVDSRTYNFPVVLLSQQSSEDMLQKAEYNGRRGFSFPLYIAKLDMVMRATTEDTQTSSECLARSSCLPLGGYSVFSALPYIPPTGSLTTAATGGAATKEEQKQEQKQEQKRVVLAVATIDSSAFFRDAAVGADSPLSGAIALLAAIDAISRAIPADAMVDSYPFPHQLAFAFLTGEAWGYLGSRQLAVHLESGSDFVANITHDRIAHVLEIGSVGQSWDAASNSVNLFAHVRSVTPSTGAMFPHLVSAAQSMWMDNVTTHVRAASKGNPGLPPSSNMVLGDEVPSLQGLVLEEFDSRFKSRFYGGPLDTYDNVNVTSVTAASTLLARALVRIAGASPTFSDRLRANASLVSDLAQCLLTDSPGLRCQLASELLTPADPRPNHYAGVFQGPPQANPWPGLVSDTSRFVWNFLAERTGKVVASGAAATATAAAAGAAAGLAAPGSLANGLGERSRESRGEEGEAGSGVRLAGEEEKCSFTCKGEGRVCVGALATRPGRCVLSTTRYMPALSPRVALNTTTGVWRVLPPRQGNTMDAVDPVWTESFWEQLGVTAYLADSETQDLAILGSGLAFFVVLVCLSMRWHRDLRKHLKQA